MPAENHAVSRDQSAGLHQHLVTELQFAEQDAVTVTVGIQLQAGRRQQVDQLRGGGRRALACPALQVSPGQQKEGEHAHRIEIKLALAGNGRPNAGDIGAADGQRYRHVHGQVAGTQVP